VATPPGEGGIAILRISGERALSIGSRVFSKEIASIPSHTVSFGSFLYAGEKIDQGLALPMHAPRSFTGEDVVEFHCHGSQFITNKLLMAIIEAGADMAKPGEFTQRAFLNGKLDLAQAEGVQALIAAKNQLAMKAAGEQLEGRLSERIVVFRDKLLEIAAILEAWVDFPEEDLEFISMEELLIQLATVRSSMQKLKDTYHYGRVIHNGILLSLVGRPNAGKSSLMNALLGYNRAIVTPVPGTTRDLLVEDVRLRNLHFRLSDSAGLRKTEDLIEEEGVRRTLRSMEQADLILYVVDATQGLHREDEEILHGIHQEKILLVWNKADLPHSIQGDLMVSALQQEGLEELAKAIEERMGMGERIDKGEVILTHARHYEAVVRTIDAVDRLVYGLESGISPEFLMVDARDGLRELSAILGGNVTEEILSAIFSKFCIGK
jgi:tRNA modification GTPase